MSFSQKGLKFIHNFSSEPLNRTLGVNKKEEREGGREKKTFTSAHHSYLADLFSPSSGFSCGSFVVPLEY